MHARRIAAIVLAAGHGTRMNSTRPKVLHPLAGQPMLRHILRTLENVGVDHICVVIGPGMESVATVAAPHATAVQHDRLGTAHAALAAKSEIPNDINDLLILNGDNPLIPQACIESLLAVRRSDDAPAVAVLGFRAVEPAAYGRLLTDSHGRLERIVEAKDATPSELETDLCNAGMMALDGATAFEMLAQIDNDNAAGEYYLPDVVAVARGNDRVCAVVEGIEQDLMGINSRAELAEAEAVLQDRLRELALSAGVTMIDPASVFLSIDTVLGRDTLIEPNVFFGPGVTVEEGVTIKAFSHIEGAVIGAGASIGPFARLRPGAQLAADVKIGNFVEIKNANLSSGAKVSHLSYIGDADVGADANIGAGTITCNYDGVFKWRTSIGAGAFIGSNTALVAPVNIGAGAIVGAGSTVASNVDADALAVTRAPLRTVKDWAKKTFARKKALKEKGEKG
jgi:bifunctional UDP-N-acetylglucosamine pyrophosphorylase/glucosamine-1-phosphate N-acetyltransferase